MPGPTNQGTAGRLSWARRHPALLAPLLVLLLAGAGLTITHKAPRAAIGSHAAVQAALRDPQSAHLLAGTGWDHVSVSDVDSSLVRVSFFRGARTAADIGVNSAGAVVQRADFTHLAVPYGSRLAYEPMVMLGLALVFVLMVGVAPLRRLRNLDVAATLSLVVPVLLLQQRIVAASVLTALPGMFYLAVRCAWLGLGPVGEPRASTPLFEHVTRGLDDHQRIRVLRLLLGALALIFVMVCVSSTGPVDVIFGVMEGATKIVNGVLPYGHMPGDVVHGDTYPILSYALYTPLAWLAPVASTWDSVDGALALGVLVTLGVAGALAKLAARGLEDAVRPTAAEAAGLRAAITWLAFPPLLIIVSTGTTDVLLAGMLVCAVVLWRRPTAATAMITAAAWFKFAPLVLLPVWLAPLRGRRLLVGLLAVVAVSAPMVGLLVLLGGTGGPAAMVHAVTFQFSRGSPQSLWSVLGIGGLQPLGEACVIALVAGAAVRLRREADLAADPARAAALAAAVLLGLQLAADYWSFLYLVWVTPLLGLSLLGPTAHPAAVASPLRAERSRRLATA